jgi:hypothetical protein
MRSPPGGGQGLAYDFLTGCRVPNKAPIPIEPAEPPICRRGTRKPWMLTSFTRGTGEFMQSTRAAWTPMLFPALVTADCGFPPARASSVELSINETAAIVMAAHCTALIRYRFIRLRRDAHAGGTRIRLVVQPYTRTRICLFVRRPQCTACGTFRRLAFQLDRLPPYRHSQ